ncbi:MAG: HlyD family efflux transporter periplasmic adaptor subunit [Candidatus Hydrogenedentes bacterium]|nr:HlyD family efflux transporter periplasmic adaptor subunit [Candidatus Hydrogenedentota bacterium]
MSNTLQTPKAGRVTELFPYEMPFRAARTIAAMLLALSGVIAAAAILLEFPETVSAPFVLLPESGSDPIQSPFDGVIEVVHAATGAEVRQGDILFVIRSPRVQELAAELRGLEKDLAATAQERVSAENTYAINREIQEAEIAQRAQETAFRKRYLDAYEDVNSRIKRLQAEGLASSLDVLNHQLGFAGAERDAALAEEEYKMAQLALSRLDAEYQQARERMENEEAKLRVRADGIASQLKQASGDLAHITAPYDGAIVSVARKRAGDVVGVGQELCQIAPGNAPPRAHLYLEERGMARLREGQPVKLLFEAFPYQRYGVVDGELAWLSPAAILAQGEERFIAHVAPERLEIGLAGAARPLRMGMRGEARIQVGRRTLIEHAFEPLRQLRENMRVQESGS